MHRSGIHKRFGTASLLPLPVPTARRQLSGATRPVQVVAAERAAQLLTEEPFVVRGHVSDAWPAITKWPGGAYLKERFGTAVVPVEVSPNTASGSNSGSTTSGSYLAPGHEVASLPLALLLDYVFGSTEEERRNPALPRLYLAQYALTDHLVELREDVPVPALLQPVVAAGHRLLTHVWIGAAGTASPPHRDPYHNWYSVVTGAKYVRLWSSTIPASAMCCSEDPLHSNTSTVADPRHPGPTVPPSFSALPYQETVLGPGDSLHIPRHWWHYVEVPAGGPPTVAVSMWWDPPRHGSGKKHAAAAAGAAAGAGTGTTPSGETQVSRLGPAPVGKANRAKPVPR